MGLRYRDEQRVRDLMFAVYGTDGSEVPVRDIQVKITEHNNPCFAYGREIAKKTERDSRGFWAMVLWLLMVTFLQAVDHRNTPPFCAMEQLLLKYVTYPQALIE